MIFQMNSTQTERRESRHHRITLLLTGLGLCLTVLAGLPRSASSAVVVHGPEEVLKSWTVSSAGRLFFRDPDGKLYEFVTDVADAAILNKGDGRFHTFDEADVLDAVDAVEYPLDELDIDLFVLPYPRRGLLDSSAGRASIYLSPGVTSYQDFQVHAVVAHEIGHLVHNQLMDEDRKSVV